MRKGIAIVLLCALTLMGTACRQPPPDTATLVARAEEVTGALALSDYPRAIGYFDSTMRKVLPADKLQIAWEEVLKITGGYRGITGTRTEKITDYEVVYVTGEFERTSYDIKVVFDRAGKVAGLFFLPIPTLPDVPMDAFRETEVTVGSGEWALPGTLTLPQGEGPFPGLVLVHGSGPNDRDETIGPNKPFRDLAWGLAARGVAVLRYDKRTKVHGAKIVGDYNLTVQEESVEDAALAAALLGGRPEVDPARVFILGHSLGGTLIPRISAAAPAVRGLVVMAGAARPLEDLMVEQYNYIFALDGTVTDEETKTLQQLDVEVAKIKNLPTSGPAKREMIMGGPASYWMDLRSYNPTAAARSLDRPLLVLQGERDYQVTMVDFGLWQAALADRPAVEFKSYPALNHLFLAGEGRSGPAEYNIPGNVAGEVVSDIAGWIKGQ